MADTAEVMRKAVALVGALLIACSTSASPSPNPALTPAAQTPPAAATPPTPAPRTSPPVATRNPANAELLLRWAPGVNISDIDDVSDIVTHLKNNPGIVDGFGDEAQITILYDPQRITPEAIRRILADMGFRTLP